MVDREVVLKRLAHLEEKIKYLNKINQVTKEEFSSEQDIYFRYERVLQLAIEAVIDLGNHLIADHNLRTPESNSDIFRILHENNMISQDLFLNLKKISGFRNILVHDYLTLDREREYEIIINNIDDIKEFMEIIANYI